MYNKHYPLNCKHKITLDGWHAIKINQSSMDWMKKCIEHLEDSIVPNGDNVGKKEMYFLLISVSFYLV